MGKEGSTKSQLIGPRWEVKKTLILLHLGQDQKAKHQALSTFGGRTHCHVAMEILPPAQTSSFSSNTQSPKKRRAGLVEEKKVELMKPRTQELY
jgi:hypothetical protein